METLVVPTRLALLGFSLSGAPVWTCGAGVGFTERIVGRRIRVIYGYQDVAVKHEIEINHCNRN